MPPLPVSTLPANSRLQAPPASHHAVAGDRPALRHHAADATALGLHPAHRAVLQHHAPGPAHRRGDRRRGLLRLGPPVGGRVQRALHRHGQPGIQRGHLLLPDHARLHLVRPGLLQPGLVRRHRAIGLAQIADAALGEAGRRLHHLVQAPPDAQAFHAQRDLALVAPHHPRPAPVAARLLRAHLALLADHDGNALLRQEQRRGHADNAAADHHHAGAMRQVAVGLHRIHARRHVSLLVRARRQCHACAGGRPDAKVGYGPRPSAGPFVRIHAWTRSFGAGCSPARYPTKLPG